MYTMQRIANGLARAAAVRAMQPLDPTRPCTWEVSALSQNGEDGITEFLTQRIRVPNRYFVEIGASDGTENNTSWLAVARRWSGLMVEGDSRKADYCRFLMYGLAMSVEVDSRFVSLDNLGALYQRFATPEPDFFSIDIDGVDWHIAAGLLELGFRPGIWVVEYNSCFGPDRAVTIPYQADFNSRVAHPTGLYYGASIQAWRCLLEAHGYRFVTVESHGVNAFFARPESLEDAIWTGLAPHTFQENFFQYFRHRRPWQEQFALIQHLPLVDVSPAPSRPRSPDEALTSSSSGDPSEDQ